MLAKIFTQRGLNFSGFRCGSSAVKFSPAGGLINNDETINRQMCRSKCGDAKGGKGGKGGKDGKGGKGAKGAKGGKGGKGGKQAKCGGDGKDGKDGKGGKGGKDGKDGKGGKFDIKGKNIIFVAGLGSIGKDTSKAILKKAPKNLILLDTKEKEKEIKCLQDISPDTKITYMPYDVTVPLDESKKLMGKVFKKFEKIDLLINGAGILDDHAIEKTIAVNFTGMVNTTVAIMDFWDKRNGCPGGICANICSVTAFNPIYQVPVYCASKAACFSFTNSCAILSPITGITAYSINPGITRTPLVKSFNSWLDIEPCVAQMLLAHPTQSTKEAAKSFVKAIEENKNGAIWKLDLGKLTKVKWTEFKHWDPKI